MKIIGKTDSGFILEAPTDEVYNLVGFYSSYGTNLRFGIGDVIKVHAMFAHLYELAGKQGVLEQCAKNLEALAGLLRVQDPVVSQAANIPERPKA